MLGILGRHCHSGEPCFTLLNPSQWLTGHTGPIGCRIRLAARRAPASAQQMAWHWPCHKPEGSTSGLAMQKRHPISDQMLEANGLIQAAGP